MKSEQQDMLPENPAGIYELTDADLEAVQGGRKVRNVFLVGPLLSLIGINLGGFPVATRILTPSSDD